MELGTPALGPWSPPPLRRSIPSWIWYAAGVVLMAAIAGVGLWVSTLHLAPGPARTPLPGGVTTIGKVTAVRTGQVCGTGGLYAGGQSCRAVWIPTVAFTPNHGAPISYTPSVPPGGREVVGEQVRVRYLPSDPHYPYVYWTGQLTAPSTTSTTGP